MTDHFSYTVAAEFTDASIRDEWVAWLRDGHLADVFRGGAIRAEVIVEDVPEGQPPRAEVRYHFASREAFATYEREHAPRLRAEGLERFPPARGIRYVRRTGHVVHRAAGESF